MLKRLPQLPLRLLIILPFGLQIFVAVGLTGWFALRHGENLINQLALQLSEQTSQQITKQVQNYLDTSELVLRMNAAMVESTNFDLDDFDQLQRLFWRQTQLTATVTTLYYGNTQGDFLQIEMGKDPTIARRTAETAPNWEVFRLDDEGQPAERLQTSFYDPRVRPWYQKAQAAGDLTWSEIYVFADPPVLGLTPALPIYRADDSLQGVIAIDLPLSQLSEFLAGLSISETGRALILERDGTIVASSFPESPILDTPAGLQRRSLEASELPVLQALVEQTRGQLGRVDLAQTTPELLTDAAGETYFLYLTPVSNAQGIDWLLAILIPQSDFQSAIAANTRTTIWMCAIALLVSTSVGLLTTGWLIQPVTRLVQATRAIAAGEWGQTVPPSFIRELNLLSQSFNRMAQRLQDTFAAWADTSYTLEQQIERRAAALNLSEERFYKVFQVTPDPILVCNFETGKIVEVNTSFLNVTGFTTAAVCHKTLDELNLWQLPGETGESIMERIHRQGKLYDVEVQFVSALGEQRWARLFAETIALQDQLCLVFIAHDLTAWKQAEITLYKQKQYLRLIIDNIPQQIFWKDTQSVFVGCNRNWAIAAGYTDPSDIIGKTDYELVNYNAARRYREEDAYVIHNDQPIFHKLDTKQKRRDPNETIWLDVTKIPLHDPDGKVIGLIGVLEDITQRKKATEALEAEREKSEALLLNILPQAIVDQLKQQYGQALKPEQPNILAQSHDQVTILFADLVGFTSLCETLSPIELVSLLNQIFSDFDELVDHYGLEKIKTIGDAYMVAGGLPTPRADHTSAIADLALAIRDRIVAYQTKDAITCQIRLGINTGSVIAGVIGTKKFIYDLWGDTVNVASRMEATGEPGCIQVTETVRDLLCEHYLFSERGEIEVKGKGLMRTFWLTGKR